MQLSNDIIQKLESIGWIVSFENNIHSIKSKDNGCQCHGEYVIPFIKELLIDIEYDEIYNATISIDEMLDLEKIDIISLSPLELLINNKISSGQCANFIISFLKDKYKKEKNILVI